MERVESASKYAYHPYLLYFYDCTVQHRYVSFRAVQTSPLNFYTLVVINIISHVFVFLSKENLYKPHIYGSYHCMLGICSVLLLLIVWIYLLCDNSRLSFRKYIGDFIILTCPIQFGNFLVARLMQGPCSIKPEVYRKNALIWTNFCVDVDIIETNTLIIMVVMMIIYYQCIRTSPWQYSVAGWLIGLFYLVGITFWPVEGDFSRHYSSIALYGSIIFFFYRSECSFLERFILISEKHDDDALEFNEEVSGRVGTGSLPDSRVNFNALEDIFSLVDASGPLEATYTENLARRYGTSSIEAAHSHIVIAESK